MGAPQIIMVVFMVFSFGAGVRKANETKEYADLGYTLIGTGVLAALLWWGGFWS